MSLPPIINLLSIERTATFQDKIREFDVVETYLPKIINITLKSVEENADSLFLFRSYTNPLNPPTIALFPKKKVYTTLPEL